MSSHWQGAILVCGKCSKKIHGGFGSKGKTRLAKLLRKSLKQKKGRKAGLGVIETKCLDLCPKNGVTLVDTRSPDRWMIVRPGDDAEKLAADLSGQV